MLPLIATSVKALSAVFRTVTVAVIVSPSEYSALSVDMEISGSSAALSSANTGRAVPKQHINAANSDKDHLAFLKILKSIIFTSFDKINCELSL